MLIDFSALDMQQRPTLVLCTAAGEPVQILTSAYNVEPNIHFNEVSTLSFDLPAYVDGMPTPSYSDVIGMRYILWPRIGLFILNNPSTNNSGAQEIKHCEAHSSEYEFTFKQLFLEKGTYCLYDPLDNSNTIVGRILELMPSWSIGSVSPSLYGKYRTFDDTTANVYDFMKSTIQESYSCVFDFDTINRRVYVYDMASAVETEPVYISLQNLAKEITIEEDTDNIFTCLDVNGAEGVNIRSVNPLGTNKIYDLSYFMTEENVGLNMAHAWQAWKSDFELAQTGYFNLVVELTLQQSRLETSRAQLVTLQGKLSSAETLLATYVEMKASNPGDYSDLKLSEAKADIDALQDEISQQEIAIGDAEDQIAALRAELKDINESLSFSNYFHPDELLVLDRYIKEDSIQETTFVAPTALSYGTTDRSSTIENNATISLEGSSVTYVESSAGKDIYNFIGGMLTLSVDGNMLTAKAVRGALELSSRGDLIVTAYLNSGLYEGNHFPSGCVSIIGTSEAITSNVAPDGTTGAWAEGTALAATVADGFFLFAENTTEYERRSIEWDLLKYGQDALAKMSSPSYTFSVDCSNFLAMDEFISFRNRLELGHKVYLDLGQMGVLEPILIGVSMNTEDPTSMELNFGDSFSCKDPEFKLTDLLDQSISAGKSADASKFTASQWVDSGASNAVKDWISSALDASKQAVISSSNQSTIFDQNGIRLRKYNPNTGTFDDEQIWMVNNNIVFTDDGWDSAKMALGHIVDKGEGIDAWGLVADLLVGKILAGESLVIQSTKQDGGVAVFRVDADGCKLHNSQFDLVNEYAGTTGQISMQAMIGLVGGAASASAPLLDYDANGNVLGVVTESGDVLANLSALDGDDLPNASFWLDMYGHAFFKGKVYAEDGEFSGTVYAKDGEFSGVVDAHDLKLNGVSISSVISASQKNNGELDYLKIGNVFIDGSGNTSLNINDNFIVDVQGHLTTEGDVRLGGNIVLSGNITWETPPIQYQFSSDNVSWHTTYRAGDVYRRESIDGGKTWGSSYQFIGTNGTNGTNGANAPNVRVKYYVSSSTSAGYDSWEGDGTDWDGKRIWARYSYDGGETWGPYVLIQGKDGANGSDANVPSYITRTKITEIDIESPTITGNNVRALKAFSVGVQQDDSFTSHGYFGLANGMDAAGNITYGVAMASSDMFAQNSGIIDYESTGQYVIVTDAGVRMQAINNNVTLTRNGIYLAIKNSGDDVIRRLRVTQDGLYWDVGEEEYAIATDGGVVAVWG